ncbi:hypothetical protein COV13_02420 [Candidatus Woesearchaeota archaeon CG10_big_fil_rev_8_21_14_0_10_32_9]|nr:MAG: hypothetical protein COV13_02420 [Candidatus Woesearchaeota archaeon CG10_big_fil_rev_8_21_14_0_10_32_9]
MNEKQIRKKGQIEIMGLLVIVILISLVIFFSLSFNLKNSVNEAPVKQDFKDAQTTGNFGTTLLETTTNCSRSIRDLLSDCAFTQEVNCAGQTSCQLANNSINRILEETLDKWNYNYTLQISSDSELVTDFNKTGCDPAKTKSVTTDITPFGTTFSSMKLTLKICR